MDAILAVDSGGTKCEMLLMQIDGRVVSFSRADTPRRESHRDGARGYGRSSEAIHKALQALLKPVGTPFRRLHLCGGSGTLSTINWRDKFPAEEILLWITTEEAAALASEGTVEGFVALAGTGAFIHYASRERECHLDAAGPLLGGCERGKWVDGVHAA